MDDEIFYEYNFIKNSKKIKILWSKDGFTKDIKLYNFDCFNALANKTEELKVTASPLICKER